MLKLMGKKIFTIFLLKIFVYLNLWVQFHCGSKSIKNQWRLFSEEKKDVSKQISITRPTSNFHRIFLNQKPDQIHVSFYCSFHTVRRVIVII